MGGEKARHDLYEWMVGAYAQEIYRCAYRLSGQRETAEDLVQESFYEAWRSLASLRDPGKGRAWLYQILRHRYAHWQRDGSRRPRMHWTFR